MADDSVQRPSERALIRVGAGTGALGSHNHPHRHHHYNHHNFNGTTTTAPHQPRQCLTWSRMVTTASSQPQHQLPPPRSGAASVVVKGKLFVFGGYGGGTGRLDDFWSFDFETNAWEEVPVRSSDKPGCRENNGVVISDSSRSIYLFGGYNGTIR